MARYSRRLGPAANYELIGTATPIPGMSITRDWDDGELLLIARETILNGTGAQIGASFAFRVDGVQVPADVAQGTIPAGVPGTITDAQLITITKGTHTIDMISAGSAAAGDVVLQNGVSFIVIQLPLWDQDADIA